MKSAVAMSRLALLPLLWCSTIIASGAELSSDQSVRLEVLVVSLPIPKALAVMPLLRHSGTFAEGDKELQALMASGEAELLGCPILRCDGGVIQSSISVQENLRQVDDRYVHGYERFYVWTSFDLLPHIADTPIDMEVDNCGLQTQATCTVFDHPSFILVDLLVNWRELLENAPPIGVRWNPSGYSTSSMPIYGSLDASSHSNLQSGEAKLFSALATQKPRPHMVLILARAISTPHPALSSP